LGHFKIPWLKEKWRSGSLAPLKTISIYEIMINKAGSLFGGLQIVVV